MTEWMGEGSLPSRSCGREKFCLAEALEEGNSAWQKLSQREDLEQVDGLFSSSIDVSL